MAKVDLFLSRSKVMVKVTRSKILEPMDYLPTRFWSFWGKAFSSYQLHKLWETNMTFDLDLWPTDLNIKRDHLLIKDPEASNLVGR